ncbi:MAG: hypothetical protein [Bacteriophage sp.]|nr:MAG: hypothetical protein [Bacteriophage sp.]
MEVDVPFSRRFSATHIRDNSIYIYYGAVELRVPEGKFIIKRNPADNSSLFIHFIAKAPFSFFEKITTESNRRFHRSLKIYDIIMAKDLDIYLSRILNNFYKHISDKLAVLKVIKFRNNIVVDADLEFITKNSDSSFEFYIRTDIINKDYIIIIPSSNDEYTKKQRISLNTPEHDLINEYLIAYYHNPPFRLNNLLIQVLLEILLKYDLLKHKFEIESRIKNQEDKFK